MNKKLIAVALAALPVAAMADVTIYGTMAGSLQHDTVSNQASQNRVEDDTSIIGFKGTEDLGNGLKTIWQIENRLHLDGTGGTNDTLASRQTWVGLDGGNLGQVRLGRINNFQNDQDNVDQWQYNSEFYYNSPAKTDGQMSGANGLGIFTNTGARLKNTVRYDSATFAVISGGLMYSFGENKPKGSNADGSTSASDIAGLGLNYTYGPVSGHYSYQKEFNPASQVGANRNQTASKHYLEVDLNQDNLFVGAAYAYATGYDWQDTLAGDNGGTTASYTWNGNNSVGAQLKTRQAALSAAYAFGPIKPKITFAKGWDESANGNSISNSGYEQYVLGVDYALSKRTTAGVAYGRIKFDKNTALAQEWNAGSDVTVKTLAFTFAHNF
ncbi:MAG: porin [Paludibacterium sp.]|uniref:porin n=1 Tax=Paludibacterium sp. TaxID=1917523 RepID=UPI0025DADC20|nr:porin [Paludibacterium sp.]MBV8049456.1 porin [Paludibacterium sp.]